MKATTETGASREKGEGEARKAARSLLVLGERLVVLGELDFELQTAVRAVSGEHGARLEG